MSEVGVREAKTSLSRLLRRVAAGEEIVITRGGRPAARLAPIEGDTPRAFGFDRGVVHIHDDFDAPLDDETLAAIDPTFDATDVEAGDTT